MTSDQLSAFAMLMAELDALPAPPATKAAFLALFRARAGERIYISRAVGAADRVEQAGRMLLTGDELPLVRDRLMALYGIGQRAAYYVIEKARHELERQDG